MLEVEDRSGLNPAQVLDMTLVTSHADAAALRQRAATEGTSVSLAGMRHSQGGHTSRNHTYMAVTETFNSVDKPVQLAAPYRGHSDVTHSVTMDAGAVWSQVHHAINPYGLAPLVHQSSAHFTIGGSISVNCHGRDHRWGAVGNTVISMNVLTGTGEVLPTSRTENPDLFKAVIGGYGSCGQILNATIAVTDNYQLQQRPLTVGDGEISVHDYQKHLENLKSAPKIQLHIGWLKFTDQDFFEKVAGYDYVMGGITGVRAADVPTVDEDYGHSEIMRAGWHAAQVAANTDARTILWGALTQQKSSKQPYRLNFMRQAISFTAYRGKQDADILLEYFVPLNRLAQFVSACKAHYEHRSNPSAVHISSGSTRLLGMADTDSNLSYSHFVGGQPMVSIALDLHIQLEAGTRNPTSDVAIWVNDLTRLALGLGGTYYLPYYRFADKALFNQAYNQTPSAKAGYESQLKAIQTYNPNKVYWNDFLEAYFKA